MRRRAPAYAAPSARSVRVQCLVELDAAAGAGYRLQRAGHRVAAQQQTVHSRQFAGLDDAAVRQGQLRAGGDVAAGLDDAVVAERDTDPGVRADQAALADPDDLLAAADVAAVADDDTRGDPALHHGDADGAGVEVDEPLVHDGRTGGQVRAEPDPVGVGDPYPRRGHVVDHPGELVHPVHGEPATGG